jgi:GT2 family glycosyltransferase
MLLSTIVVSASTRDLLEQCLGSATAATAGLDSELIVVDNASTDGSPDMVRERFPGVRVIANDSNLGFATASNQGLRACSGQFALLLNSDTVVSPNALATMVEFMVEHPRAGIVGPRLVGRDGATQASASDLPGLRMQIASFLGLRHLVPRSAARALAKTPVLGRAIDTLSSGYLTPALSSEPTQRTPRQVGFISGACLLARREMWEEIGVLDERIFLFLEDADWCRRAGESGWELWYIPEVKIVHLGGQSFRARSGGRSHHISRERCTSLIYYFNKHEPAWKVSLLRLVVLSSLRARLLKLAVRRAAHQIDPETYAADASLLRDALRVTRD